MEGIYGSTALTAAFARNLVILQRQTAGLSHADSLIQPPVRGNCLNWIVGHIAAARAGILGILGEPPVLPAERLARYGRGSAPILADGEGVLPLADLLDVIARAQEGIAAGLEKATSESLARMIPFGAEPSPASEVLFLLYFHETYHTGQTELLRQLAGKDDHVL